MKTSYNIFKQEKLISTKYGKQKKSWNFHNKYIMQNYGICNHQLSEIKDYSFPLLVNHYQLTLYWVGDFFFSSFYFIS